MEKCKVNTYTGNVSHVVTPLAVFIKQNGILKLDCIFPYSSYEEVAENTEFRVTPAPYAPLPTKKEISLLREFDPDGLREIEFQW